MKNIKKKISKIRLLRIIIQILSFILMPGLYVIAFSGVKQIYLSIYQGEFDFVALLPQIIAFLVVIPITMIAGRFFCSWMCAFGSLGDLIYSLSKFVIKKRRLMPEGVDRVLKYLKYVILIILIVAGWSFGLNTFQNANPWDAFGMLFTFGAAPDIVYVLSNLAPAFFILVAILIASFFVERFFCRYLCPLGAVFDLTSKLRITAIAKPSDKCGSCRICTKNCPMGIPLYKKEAVNSGECINCLLCITKCPRSNIGLTVMEQDVRPVLFSTLALSAIVGGYYVGSFATTDNVYSTATSQDTTQVSEAATTQVSTQKYQDGTYEGSGRGFRRGITTVSVTITKGMISDISVISTKDYKQFFSHAYSPVAGAIIEKQAAEVDAVSGATYSSNGIMSAVTDALSKAL